MKVSSRRAFTLIELMVVISIVGVMSTLSVVSVSRARDAARFSAIQTMVSETHKAVLSYREVTGGIIMPGINADTREVALIRAGDGTVTWRAESDTGAVDTTSVADPAAQWDSIFSGNESTENGLPSYGIRLNKVTKASYNGVDVPLVYLVRAVSVDSDDPLPYADSLGVSSTASIDSAKRSADYSFTHVSFGYGYNYGNTYFISGEFNSPKGPESLVPVTGYCIFAIGSAGEETTMPRDDSTFYDPGCYQL